MLKLQILILIIFQKILVLAQINNPYCVYLIGDAGSDTIAGNALLMLKEELLLHPNSTVIFLGDNVYPSGLKSKDPLSAGHLESQLNILKNYKGNVYFIPGNHDWQAQGHKGLKRVLNQQIYVEDYLKNNTSVANKASSTFLPKNGLPGPESLLINDKLRLVIIDTQWFLHLYKKTVVVSKSYTKKLFFFQLDSLLNLAKEQGEQLIIAMHHPMFTNGKHAANKQPLRFLISYTPFGIFGFLGLNRLLSQDLAHPQYKKMRNKMLKLFNEHNNIICASGHDHNLQCFLSGTNRYIVSGAGSKLSHFQSKNKFNSVFQDDKREGFVKIEYAADGSHKTIIYRVGKKEMLVDSF